MTIRQLARPPPTRTQRPGAPARSAGSAMSLGASGGRAPTCACGGRCPRCALGSRLQLAPADSAHEQQADAAARRRLWGEPAVASATQAAPPRGAPLQPGARDRIERVLEAEGEPLPASTRSRMESQLGTSLADIRVHHDASAQRAARGIDAAAFSVGRRIVFADGAYDPDSLPGQALLAHELQHASTAAAASRTVHRSLETYVKAMNRKPNPDWNTAAVHLNGEPPKIIRQLLALLDPPRRAKLHAAARSFPGVCSNIARFTEPEYLALNPTVTPTDYSTCGGAPAPAPVAPTPSKPAAAAGASFTLVAAGKGPYYSNPDSLAERREVNGVKQVYLEGPTFGFIANVNCAGPDLGKWQVGHMQDLTGYELRGTYSDGAVITFDATFPIRDSADDLLYPFYYKKNVRTAAAGSPVVTSHLDSPHVMFDSQLGGADLVSIDMKFTAIDWVVARQSATGDMRYVHHASWGFTRGLKVPSGAAALPDPSATNDAIVQGSGQGSTAPSLTTAVYNKSAKARRIEPSTP